MSKNKELEKKLEKEIEKIKPEKEFEKRKELKQEIKEKPEKSEMKEFKEKLEIKERFKEFKDIERKLFDKGGKEIVEGGGIDPGIMFRAEKPEEGAAGAPKPEPELKQKEIEKIKPEKEFPDKIQKEIEKIKPEKEFEKFHKELEKIKPEKEYPEKFHIKSEFEKLSVETKLDPGTPLFKGSGSPEDRISELEDAVERLTHFIGVDLRPDLTTGALKGEPDAGGTGGEAKADDKKKPK
jgi:hypothetical protein